jgi:hypothetical protein
VELSDSRSGAYYPRTILFCLEESHTRGLTPRSYVAIVIMAGRNAGSGSPGNGRNGRMTPHQTVPGSAARSVAKRRLTFIFRLYGRTSLDLDSRLLGRYVGSLRPRARAGPFFLACDSVRRSETRSCRRISRARRERPRARTDREPKGSACAPSPGRQARTGGRHLAAPRSRNGSEKTWVPVTYVTAYGHPVSY